MIPREIRQQWREEALSMIASDPIVKNTRILSLIEHFEVAIEGLEQLHKYFLDRVPEHREYAALDKITEILKEIENG